MAIVLTLKGRRVIRARVSLFWTPYVTHYFDSIITYINKLDMKKVMKRGQSLTKFLSNCYWVHGLMKKFIDGEIL